jgi:hypothetical protein
MTRACRETAGLVRRRRLLATVEALRRATVVTDLQKLARVKAKAENPKARAES